MKITVNILYALIALKGSEWFETKYVPFISPITLISLLFTIIVMFSLKGELIVQIPMDVVRIAIPLVIYFTVMFILSFFVGKYFGADYSKATAIAFTATGNNFELSHWCLWHKQWSGIAGVIGPLVEVPALIALINVAFWFRKKHYKTKLNIKSHILSDIRPNL
ncbi:Arsenical-resistance protein Acr3 [Flavobacterium collinsii]|uniref:Arsenical-resistance protein Acr3 n=1 Tax=Flavobacterium collinsii TaxID=1114861 RepID=A0ABM8KHJ5_9FLAO|nr:Arsenical-resistance protein Acr3 [Flavobacterium collinsii]